MDIIIDCPLGSKCEYISDDKKLHRCAWYVQMKGQAQSGEVYDQWNCAISWQPILMVETAGINRRVASSIDSMRNETVVRQEAAIALIRDYEDAKKITSV